LHMRGQAGEIVGSAGHSVHRRIYRDEIYANVVKRRLPQIQKG
jgi:hypothetical protein